MAKFIKTINLYDRDTNGVTNLEKIESGELVINRGQWVRTSINGKPSRWVGISPTGSVWCVHYQGGQRYKGECMQRWQFRTLCQRASEWAGTDAERFENDRAIRSAA